MFEFYLLWRLSWGLEFKTEGTAEEKIADYKSY